MKVSNPSADRELRAQVEGEWYVIPPGRSIEVDSERVAVTLAEYGASVDPTDLAYARDAMAGQNRAANAAHASVPAAVAQEVATSRHAQLVAEAEAAGARPLPVGVPPGTPVAELVATDPAVTPETAGTVPSSSTPETAPPAAPYDPEDYSAAEVKAYLDTASDAERARVIAVERERSRPRTSIVDYSPPA